MSKNVIIVGGHGNISMKLARRLSPVNNVVSIVRNSEHEGDIKEIGATSLILSLEDSPVSDFVAAFEGKDIVYFAAGAGTKGGEGRTKAVDHDGAIKVFDALEAIKGRKPRLILVSAIDVRDPEKIPEHYTEADIAVSKRVRGAIPVYMHWKYQADKDLIKRTAFQWIILRPGGLNDNPGTGKAAIGRAPITKTISRDDVAAALALLLDREDASGLAIDIAGGETPLGEGLDGVIKKRQTDFLG